MENHKLVLPEHLNHYGFLFGGYLLMWVDEIAWIAASLEFPDCLFVTVAMAKVEFQKSVRQGSILRFETHRTRLGTTSVTYEVVVKRKDETIFSTDVSLVNVDESGSKKPITAPAED
jgi:acyl-CoA hydrolase